jgi:hypothetical protein
MKAIWVTAEVEAGGDYPHSSYALTALDSGVPRRKDVQPPEAPQQNQTPHSTHRFPKVL